MLRFLLRTGVRRGLFGGSRTWTTVAGVLFGVKMLKRLTGGEPELVHSTKLRPGESLVVRHERQPRSSHRRRR